MPHSSANTLRYFSEAPHKIRYHQRQANWHDAIRKGYHDDIITLWRVLGLNIVKSIAMYAAEMICLHQIANHVLNLQCSAFLTMTRSPTSYWGAQDRGTIEDTRSGGSIIWSTKTDNRWRCIVCRINLLSSGCAALNVVSNINLVVAFWWITASERTAGRKAAL